jgi:hypothetical protein
MTAITRAMVCAVAVAAAAPAGAVCTPATINPSAVQAIRPYMSPASVSGVLGCAPTEIGPVWIWGVPLVDQAGAKIQVAVAFDAASANGALRVDPGGWVPGAAVAP